MNIPKHEDICNEFKSDKKNIGYKELAEAVVCLANANGGSLWIGIEDNGEITGVSNKKNNVQKLIAGINNNISGYVELIGNIIDICNKKIIEIKIKKSNYPLSTADGKYVKRRMTIENKPECKALSPLDIASMSLPLASQDFSSYPLSNASLEDLDPLEREKLKRWIQISHGDESLLQLSDEELDDVLVLTKTINGVKVPTVTGLLLIGKEAAIRKHLYNHELAFQILEGETVRVNEFIYWPILKSLEWIENVFIPFTKEEEIQINLLRMSIPRINKKVLREATLNAFSHRDYSKSGNISIQMNDVELTISNPGGFVEGVTKENILTVPPHARNPCLANALKRIGLVERVGRGVDTIYSSVLRDGRLPPSYERTTEHTVILDIPVGESDINFASFISKIENTTENRLFAQDLLFLSLINSQKNITTKQASDYFNINKVKSKNILEKLLEKGLVEARGKTTNRYYMLSASMYSATGKTEEYVRQSGFKPLQCEQMIISFLQAKYKIKRKDVMSLCSMTDREATRILQAMVKKNMLVARGERRGTYYVLPN